MFLSTKHFDAHFFPGLDSECSRCKEIATGVGVSIDSKPDDEPAKTIKNHLCCGCILELSYFPKGSIMDAKRFLGGLDYPTALAVSQELACLLIDLKDRHGE